MNKINIKFVIQNNNVTKCENCSKNDHYDHDCSYYYLKSIIINDDSARTIIDKLLNQKLEVKEIKLNNKIRKLEKEIKSLKKEIEDLKKEIEDLKNLTLNEIRKKYIKDLDWSETTIKPLMPGLYYHDKTYIACFPKIFNGKQKYLESNQEKLKKIFQ